MIAVGRQAGEAKLLMAAQRLGSMHMRGRAGRSIVAQVKYRTYAILLAAGIAFSPPARCKAP
jgi:hypothetical protein